ncbi:hypothetical protein FraQA3DRAFT_2646, partial [Frankia sp. QA3]
MPVRGDPSLVDLLGRLAAVEQRVRAAVAARRATDPDPDDAFRGLYLSDEHVDTLLRRPPTSPDATPTNPPRDPPARAAGESVPRLAELAGRLGLTPLDVDILLVALAPDLDARFEKLYGYLHDDVTRRRASPGLVLELCGRSPLDAAARARCTAAGPLVAAGLLVVEEPERPFLTRSLRVPDRIAGHLLGDDRPAPALAAALADAPDVGGSAVARLAEVLRDGPGRLAYLRTGPGADGLAVAASATRRAGRPLLALDLPLPGRPGDP